MKNIFKKFVATFIIFVLSGGYSLAALSNADLGGVNNGATVDNAAINKMTINLNNGGQTNLNWNKLNVNSNETLNFNFLQNGSTAYNSISGGVSTIAGKINAIGNGAETSNIILSNPSGVTFVNGSVVNVGAMSVYSRDGSINIDGSKFTTQGDLNLTVDANNGKVEIKNINTNNFVIGKDFFITMNGSPATVNIQNA